MATAPPSYEEANKNQYGNNPPYPTAQPAGQPPYPTGQVPYPPGQVNPVSAKYGTSGAYQPPVGSGGEYNYQYQAGDPPPTNVGDSPYNGFNDNTFSFDSKSVRHGFIRKVYLIMTAQLLVTCAFIAIFQFVRPVQKWVKANSWFYYLSYATFIVTYIVLVCCSSVRKKYPGNFICLSVFTLALSYLTATIASFYDTPAVLSAAAITAVVCISITIFAIQTKVDFTLCSGLILVASIVLLMTGLICMILYLTIGPSRVVHGVYAGIAILVFSLYLVYDTQLIIGGRKYELSPEEYIEGALQLYLDIVNMFLIILSLFGGRSN